MHHHQRGADEGPRAAFPSLAVHRCDVLWVRLQPGVDGECEVVHHREPARIVVDAWVMKHRARREALVAATVARVLLDAEVVDTVLPRVLRLEELRDLRRGVARHLVQGVLRRHAHRDQSLLDICQVQVVAVLGVPRLVASHKRAQRVGSACGETVHPLEHTVHGHTPCGCCSCCCVSLRLFNLEVVDCNAGPILPLLQHATPMDESPPRHRVRP